MLSKDGLAQKKKKNHDVKMNLWCSVDTLFYQIQGMYEYCLLFLRKSFKVMCIWN